MPTMNFSHGAIGFDADDTLWHNESLFERVHERYRALLARYHDAATVDAKLLDTERRNIGLYGYGVKGFTLSAIETAIQLTGGKVSADEIQSLIALGRELLDHPVDVFDGVADTLAELSEKHALILITKGDLFHQERKLVKSGLGERFRAVEIVSEKDVPTYQAILRRYGIPAERFLMVGNSLKSDILPVLDLGGAGVHIPYEITWALERATPPNDAAGRFFQVKNIRELPPVVTSWLGR